MLGCSKLDVTFCVSEHALLEKHVQKTSQISQNLYHSLPIPLAKTGPNTLLNGCSYENHLHKEERAKMLHDTPFLHYRTMSNLGLIFHVNSRLPVNLAFKS